MFYSKLMLIIGVLSLVGCATSESIKYTQLNPPAAQKAKSVNLNVYTHLLKKPSPTIIYAHGCSGLDGVYLDWRNKINEWGFNVVQPESNKSRGAETACGNVGITKVTHYDKLEDLIETAKWVKQQPWHSGKIGVIGFSHGAIAALNLAANGGVLYPLQTGISSDVYLNSYISAVVAYYPNCRIGHKRAAIPSLILIGELDDMTPPTWCKVLEEESKYIRSYIYPGVYHSFDVKGFNHINNFGYTVRYDSKAALDAEKKTKLFFEENLK